MQSARLMLANVAPRAHPSNKGPAPTVTPSDVPISQHSARWLIPVVPFLLIVAGYADGHDWGRVTVVMLELSFGVSLAASAAVPAIALSERPNFRNGLTLALVVVGVVAMVLGHNALKREGEGTIFGFWMLEPVGAVMWICGCLRHPSPSV